jgi:hypothetical protein
VTKEQERLQALIEEAKALHTYPNINWSDSAWDVTDFVHTRGHQRGRIKFMFERLSSTKGRRSFVPFESLFSDLAKTLIRMSASQRGLNFQTQLAMITALRFLYEALNRTGTVDPTKLLRKHFYSAVAHMQEVLAYGSAYMLGHKLKQIAVWVSDNKICRVRINFKNPLACPWIPFPKLDAESQSRELEKMPSPSALKALAMISNSPENESEHIIIRIVDLHVACGFRIGEGLTLPVDCWVEELALDERGQSKIDTQTKEPIKRCGIRYWPEKGGDTAIKWLPDLAVPLARRAVDDLKRLCAPARAAAAIVEKTPSRISLPGKWASEGLLSLKQIADILELKSSRHARLFLIRTLGLKPAATNLKRTWSRYQHLYRVREIEEALSRQVARLGVVRKPDGKKQMLSESLCVIFRNQFNYRRPTIKLLPEPIGYSHITRYLGGIHTCESMFARRGVTKKDGSPLRIKTHAFRHWLNTLADQGGLSDVDLALWMGRRDIRTNAAYKHGTVEQRAAWAREMIESGRLQGPVADTYHSINDPVDRERFLETFVSVAHFTPWGVCTHDFAMDPCPYHLQCLNGCAEYLRTRGDQEERSNLLGLREHTLVQLTRAKEATDKNVWGASNWIVSNEQKLIGIDAALAVDSDITLELDSGKLQVFPAGKSLWKGL